MSLGCFGMPVRIQPQNPQPRIAHREFESDERKSEILWGHIWADIHELEWDGVGHDEKKL